MKILIADDDPVCLKRLEYFFKDSSEKILYATNGLDAWDIIEEESIQLAILDWEMPGLSGVEICRDYRQKKSSDFLYMMLLTGRNSRQDINEGIELGADDFLTKPLDLQELKVRLRAATRIIEFQEIVSRAAQIDPLTDIWNRRAIFNALHREHERSIRSGHSYSVILCDIDYFKKINDQFGHQSGDRVLIQVAQRIRENLRTADFVGRYGGEEFLILLPETELPQAQTIAERLRICIEEPFMELGSGSLPVTLSLGIGVNPQGIQSIESLLSFADQALYASKNAGRNRVTVYQMS